jgi:serine/threonine protein kinase
MNTSLSHPRRSSPNLALGLVNAPEYNTRGTRSLVTSPTQEQFFTGNGTQLPDLFSHLYLSSKDPQGTPMDSQLSPKSHMRHRSYRENDRGHSAAPDYLQNIPQILPRPPRSPMISAQQSSEHDISDDESLGPVPVRPRVPSSAAKAEPEEPAPSSLADYVLGPEVGRGAYGFVLRARYAREFNDSEYPLLIKFIYKSCILADSWRRHRIYGVLPAEIFVLMQVQSIPYDPPAEVPPYIIDKPFWIERRNELLGKQRNGTSVGQPTICGLVDFFEDPEYYYMVMPRFGEGRDLFDEVESCLFGLDMTHARCYLGQLAEALAFLHANSFVHRDVKDENVIIDNHAMVQLIDFGSAARLRAGRMFDTFSGTLDYAAAEILEGKPYAGPPQDVWAFGVVAFVLVCGECPFRDGTEACEGLKENSRPLNLLHRVCRYSSDGKNDEMFFNDDDTTHTDQLSAEAGDPAVHDVMDLIQQCLLLNPDERPTASDLLAHRFIRGPDGWLSADRRAGNVM